jgi:hypothetical protein
MEAQHILQDRPLASEETLDMDDPVVQVNLRNLLEKCTYWSFNDDFGSSNCSRRHL